LPILCYQFALESGGRQFWFFAGLFGWVVPIMASIVMGLAMGDIPELVVYLMAVSGLSMPFNAVRVGFDGMRGTSASAATGWSLALHAVVLAFLVWWALRKRGELRRKAMGEGEPAGDP
jgi:hypothetical protein